MNNLGKKIARNILAITVLAALLSACGGGRAGVNKSGRFLPGDGLPTNHRVDIAAVPNAVPKKEPLSKTGNQPYQVYGESYTPLKSAGQYQAEGVASWYGTKFHGKRTSSGEPYNMYAMSAAHRTLPLPSYVRVTNLSNQRSVIVKVNDRGPFVNTDSRIIDLSYVAAAQLGVVETGTAQVRIESVEPMEPELKLSENAQSISVRDGISTQDSPETEILIDTPLAIERETVQTPEIEQMPQFEQVPEIEQAPETEQASYLQMGAFSIRYNAEQLVRRLSQMGIVADIQEVNDLYKVISGPFTNADQALRQKLEIDRLLNLKSRLLL